MTARSLLAGVVFSILFTLGMVWAADYAEAATECETFAMSYEVRPGPARDLIGVTVEIYTWDLPDHWLGMPGTVHVETANGPSVHWNNYLTLTTNGFTTNVTGTEDTANGVRIGDTNIDAIGADLVADYTIGNRDRRDVPGPEGASLEGTVTICATLPDVTTTTTTTTSSSTTQPVNSTTTTTNGSTTTVPPNSSTSSAPPTTAPTGSTTTTSPDETTTTVPGSSTSTTVPPVSTPDPTLPFTGPTTEPGIWLAIGALLTLGGAAWLSRLGVRGEGR